MSDTTTRSDVLRPAIALPGVPVYDGTMDEAVARLPTLVERGRRRDALFGPGRVCRD